MNRGVSNRAGRVSGQNFVPHTTRSDVLVEEHTAQTSSIYKSSERPVFSLSFEVVLSTCVFRLILFKLIDMAAPIELATEDKLEYTFIPNNSGIVQFRVRTSNDAHIALTTGAAESEPMYEVFIGGWGNSKSVIRKNRQKPDVAEVPTPQILNGGEFRGFWVKWNEATISAGREGESFPFITWTDSEFVPISYVGVCTGWGASGSWIIEQPQGGSIGSRSGGGGGGGYGGSGAGCWVAASNGSVPPRALPGGEDQGETLFVARARFQGALIPGKLVPSHGTCYVPWGGTENPVPEYEILCDCGGTWVASSGGNIPPNAIPAGESEDGEPLYIGRVPYEGSLTVGKIQPSHNICYIPFAGQELGFPDYEILVS